MSKIDVVADGAIIAAHWREENYIHPASKFIGQAYLTDAAVFERFSEENFPECFREYADLLDWKQYWHTTLDSSRPPFFKWFVGGKLNACHNCVDRHLDKHRNKAAFYFVPEQEGEPIVALTYQQLYRRVNEVAAMLRDFCGLKRGDRVTLHLPMTLELPITMLACARLGVIHSQVFSGFSASACAHRIVDSRSRVLITMDAYHRGGKLVDHGKKAEQTVAEAAREGVEIEKVLMWRRYPGQYRSEAPLLKQRDFFVDEALAGYRGKEVTPEIMDANDTLFLMYTSGTTGKPKAAQHSTGGYLAYVAGTSKYIEDIHPEDVYWCMADIGWITGHSYIVYGPLALAATAVIYEGVPTFPDAGRLWRIAEELGVNIFHTSPTAIRALRRAGPDTPARYKHRFKHMTTVGEPIEPEAWRWFWEMVGKREAVIVDTWWQTETGGHLCATVPGIHPMKPGSAGPGAPGVYPAIYDENGREIPRGSPVAGNICIRNPWPGRMLTIWGDDERFVKTYYSRYCNPDSKDWRDWPYFAGDGALQADDGYIRILGRIDDVINVAGHRLGTKELEAACLTVPEVAEAAVVAVPDEIKGAMPDVYVSLQPGVAEHEAVSRNIAAAIADQIGPIARPRFIWLVPDLPKTRSGKIMRRVLAAVSTGRDPGDLTTLANPEVVQELRDLVAEKVTGIG